MRGDRGWLIAFSEDKAVNKMRKQIDKEWNRGILVWIEDLGVMLLKWRIIHVER